MGRPGSGFTTRWPNWRGVWTRTISWDLRLPCRVAENILVLRLGPDRSLETSCAGSRLVLRDGQGGAAGGSAGTAAAVAALAEECGATSVYWNRVYEPAKFARDEGLASELCSAGVEARSFVGSVLYEPGVAAPDSCDASLQKGFGSVGFFTAATKPLGPPPPPHPSCAGRPLRPPLRWPASCRLADLRLLQRPRRNHRRRPSPAAAAALFWEETGEDAEEAPPAGRPAAPEWLAPPELRRPIPAQPDGAVEWWAPIRRHWASVGGPPTSEAAAQAALRRFLQSGSGGLFESDERFRADQSNTAELSPFLRFGQLSPRQVYAAAAALPAHERSHTFLRRLAWRDLAYWFLWRFPTLPDAPFRPHYAGHRWLSTETEEGAAKLAAWQSGA